ncbi:MAG: mevalonate kinase [Candidatus Aenigmarchaeota archaeon]|nr:mevalonate kinase [Candidatus Aenigmarchaeota archaeon]
MVKVSAPGKVHLIGEHSVVYGEPAIIAAIGKRCFIEVEKSDKVIIESKNFDFKLESDLDEINRHTEEMEKLWERGDEKNDFSEVLSKTKNREKALKILVGKCLKLVEADSGVSVVIYSEIPAGAGLGSSASINVALTKAISKLYGKDLSNHKVNDFAYELEKFMHGKPSGGDNSACCFGGLVWFKKGDPNVIDSLREEIPYKLENFVLVHTKTPEKTTGELVQMVMNLDPSSRDPIIKNLGDATLEMREVLKRKDFKRMKELINLANENLTKLGLSIPETEEISKAVTDIGGAAKMCGACYGGTMLCYHEDKEKLIKTIKDLGFEPIETELSVEGVKLEGS